MTSPKQSFHTGHPRAPRAADASVGAMPGITGGVQRPELLPSSPRRGLLPQVATFIHKHRLLAANQAVLVPVSGGLDSVVLLDLLRQLARRQGWQLAVAHFNHQLRGAESDADESWVARVAKRWKLPFVAERGDVRALAREESISIEMAARRLRHDFLASTARKLGIRRVALAHHADDQIELFFLRLFRGSGPDGLAGMRPSSPSPADPRVRLIRPLLEVRRAELESYARLQGIQHREDSSNADLDILRNRVRRELLPLLEQRYQPGLASVVLRTMQLLEAETEVTAAETAKWFSSRSRRRFAGLPVAVQRRVLRQQLEQAGIPADFGWIETLRLHRGHPVSIAAGLRLRRLTSGGLVFERTSRPAFHPEQLPVSLAGKSGVFRFDGREIRWRRELCPAGRGRLPAQRPGREYFDADSVGTTMVVRCWRPGDRFQPLGMERNAKLQDLFVNAKVPRDDRRRRILAEARGGALFWVEGLAPGEPFKIRAATRHRLRWEWTECAVEPV